MAQKDWTDLTFGQVRQKCRNNFCSHEEFLEWEKKSILEKIPLCSHNDETAIIFETSMLKNFSLKTAAFIALMRSTMEEVQLFEEDKDSIVFLVIYQIKEIKKILGEDYDSVLKEAKKSQMFHFWVNLNGFQIIFGLTEKLI